MIAGALFLLVAAPAPQEPGALDVPVYRDEAFGVALPRPFPDWVFSPGAARGTTTVIFHPRERPLGEQLWGVLLLTTLDESVDPADIAERRLRETWRPTLGRTFRMLARDTLTVAGLPAVHLLVSGAVDRVAVDIEEYVLARDTDLVILQFRYPRALPRDSVAAGYRRVLEGLSVRAPPGVPSAAAAPAAAARPGPQARDPDSAANRALAGSPWRARDYDALVRFDAAAVRLEFSVRVAVVNDDSVSCDSLAFALPWPLLLDSAWTATGRPLDLEPGTDVEWVRLPQAVAPGAADSVVIAFHAPADAALRPDIGVLPDGAHVFADWLPWVAPWADSAGVSLAVPRPGFTIRFDLPPSFAAVAAGRLTADVVAAGRRRTTWVAGRSAPPLPEFVIGRLQRAATRAGPLVTLHSWAAEGAPADALARTERMAEVIVESWRFFTTTFGRLAAEDAYLLVPPGGRAGTAGSTLRLPPDAPDDSVRVAVARVWWGSTVRFVGPDAAWLADALPAWSVLLFHQVMDADSTRQRTRGAAPRAGDPAAAIEALRRQVGDAAFRTALRRFFLEHRAFPAARAEFLSYLGLAN